MQDECGFLIRRLQELCPDEHDGASDEEINELASSLQVELSSDFRRISSVFPGGELGSVSNYEVSCADPAFSIVGETLRLRTVVGLPHNYVVLAEPPESLIVMDTASNCSVLWLDAVEVHKLTTFEPLTNPDFWDSYLSYFEGLLDIESDDV